MMRPLGAFALLAALSFVVPGSQELLAQGQASAPRSMSHFWHVFIAYAVAWLLLLGWVFAIVRRIARVERRLDN